jgi:hypothetical protein
MHAGNIGFKRTRGQDWTAERIERLETHDVRQLRENAHHLGESEVVALCDAILRTRPRETSRRASLASKRSRNLISRHKAFEARGVFLPHADSGWSGVRPADGAVLMTLWAPAIVESARGCNVLLWGPNEGGSRPWSDSAAGRTRLKNCKLALERGGGEGILVYGEHFEGEAAEHNARSVYGADPERLIHFKVEQRGAEYWAVWGARALEPA